MPADLSIREREFFRPEGRDGSYYKSIKKRVLDNCSRNGILIMKDPSPEDVSVMRFDSLFHSREGGGLEHYMFGHLIDVVCYLLVASES